MFYDRDVLIVGRFVIFFKSFDGVPLPDQINLQLFCSYWGWGFCLVETVSTFTLQIYMLLASKCYFQGGCLTNIEVHAMGYNLPQFVTNSLHPTKKLMH